MCKSFNACHHVRPGATSFDRRDFRFGRSRQKVRPCVVGRSESAGCQCFHIGSGALATGPGLRVGSRRCNACRQFIDVRPWRSSIFLW